MPRALKVFRTPIGFHDAYVAAPTQKAALEAWGSDANLFARGVAEIVTDPTLTEAPLAAPGRVIKRLRGTTQDHFDALPRRAERPPAEDRRAVKKPAKPKPVARRPSRAKLDETERAAADLRNAQRVGIQELDRREEALRRERGELEQRHAAAMARAEAAVAQAKARYDAAIGKWRADS